ncbi:uncharacterized protein METZ01_LOCUS319876, partial [marine metagenome]
MAAATSPTNTGANCVLGRGRGRTGKPLRDAAMRFMKVSSGPKM